MEPSLEEFLKCAEGLEVGQLDCLVRLMRMLTADLGDDEEPMRAWTVAPAGEPLAVGMLVG